MGTNDNEMYTYFLSIAYGNRQQNVTVSRDTPIKDVTDTRQIATELREKFDTHQLVILSITLIDAPTMSMSDEVRTKLLEARMLLRKFSDVTAVTDILSELLD